MAELTPVAERVILHWGEMGSVWGINRTIAQMFALLYLSPQPLTAEEISETLSVARSTVSTGLRELQGWGIVNLVQVLGDRRDHFEATADVWEIFRTIVTERKRREIDPTLAVLRESVAEFEDGDGENAYVRDRLQEMLNLFGTVTKIFDQLEKMPTAALVKLTEMGEAFGRVLLALARD